MLPTTKPTTNAFSTAGSSTGRSSDWDGRMLSLLLSSLDILILIYLTTFDLRRLTRSVARALCTSRTTMAQRSLSTPHDPQPDRLPPILVMYHPSMRKLAENLVKRVQTLALKQSASAHGVELWDGTNWQHFRDGWPNIFISNVDKIAGRDVILLASFHSPQVIFEQLSLIYSLPRYLVRSFRLILPYFPTATMERVDKEGQVVTAKSLATMLSQIPLAARGPAQIIVFDIHALQERFYFTDQVIPRLLTAMPLLKRELGRMEKEKVAVVFPDEGAWKRFHSDLSGWPSITCIKVREGDKRVVSIKDGDPRGCHVVIVDDLVQTGGTLLQCAKTLQFRGAAAISVFVTHPVFPEGSWKQFTAAEEVQFTNFWITDSIPHALELAKHPPFKLLSLSDVIADSLLGYDLSLNG